jgi:hypothetical protein
MEKGNLEQNLNLAEDWYRAVIFDQSGKIIASKNAQKTNETELV